MRTSKKLLTVLGGNQFDDLIVSLNPLEWLSFRETSGTSLRNRGSLLNANGVWTPGAGALGQVGQLGANDAADFDGAASLVTITYNAALDGLTEFTFAALFKADTVGEGNTGILYCWGNNNTTASLRFVNATQKLIFAHRYSVTNMLTISNVALTLGQWYWVFATYSQSVDRVGHIYHSSGGAAVEDTYQAGGSASVGTVVVTGVTPVIGNMTSAAATWDGLIDEVMWFNRVLTQAEMNNIIQKSNLFL